jgi:hypothetical protein
MGTLWQFFGFPDPEAPPPEAMKKSKEKEGKEDRSARTTTHNC